MATEPQYQPLLPRNTARTNSLVDDRVSFCILLIYTPESAPFEPNGVQILTAMLLIQALTPVQLPLGDGVTVVVVVVVVMVTGGGGGFALVTGGGGGPPLISPLIAAS